jgi:hypothetical protein
MYFFASAKVKQQPARAMLHPLLISCMVAWFCALVSLWVALDIFMLDRNQQPLRDNAARFDRNGQTDMATLARSELGQYPRTATAIYTSSILGILLLVGSALLASRKAGLSRAAWGAVALTLCYLTFLTTQAWVTRQSPSNVGWVAADFSLGALTFVSLLVAGVYEAPFTR